MNYITTFLFGLLFGSFFNVCIYRIPRLHLTLTDASFANLRKGAIPLEILSQLEPLKDQEYIGEDAFLDALEKTIGEEHLEHYGPEIFKHASRRRESIVFPGSHCPHCNSAIMPWDNIPVLSFIILQGKCRSCGARISPRYPFVELLTAMLFVLLVHQFGITLQTFIYLLFVSGLLIISFVDIDHTIIPDVISKPGILIGVIASFSPSIPLRWHDAVLGALVGSGLILLIVYVGPLIFKQEAMGLGDVKLMAMIGAFLGWKFALITIFFGSFLGAVAGGILILFGKTTLKSYLPFGPFLCAGALISLLFGTQLSAWYWNLFLPPL